MSIDIQADDLSLRGHTARAHVDAEHGTVTIGVTHTTYDEVDAPHDEGWNIHLDTATARAWARAILAATEGG